MFLCTRVGRVRTATTPAEKSSRAFRGILRFSTSGRCPLPTFHILRIFDRSEHDFRAHTAGKQLGDGWLEGE